MSAQELWQAGRLDEAIQVQLGEVKAAPMDADRRYLLFSLCAFAGDLERAARQLDALALEDEKLAAATAPYHNLLAAESERVRSHAGDATPLLPPDAPETLQRRVELILAKDGDHAEALQAIEAEERAIAGQREDTAFSGWTETDEALGPTLELFAGGRWLLLPFSHVRSLELDPPKHLLDLLWAPVRLVDRSGNEADAHLPALYFGSTGSSNDQVRLGRSTAWEEHAGLVRGFGQRTWCFEGEGEPEDVGVLSIRRLETAE